MDLHPPLSVKPRNRRYKRLPVVALDHDLGMSWLGEDNACGPMLDMVAKLNEWSPTVFAMEGAADFLAVLNTYWRGEDPKHWQYRVTENERSIRTPGNARAAARVTTVVHYFGFKSGNYHKLIDPITMYGHSLRTVFPVEHEWQTRQEQLLAWATRIRDFCDENGIAVRPTIGSLSAQFWTDPRFYPTARRKVPTVINARAREQLPGNHYALFTFPTERREFTAHYIDQTRAHHYHARTTRLPHPDALYAYGNFLNLTPIIVWPEIPADFSGLLCVQLELPRGARDKALWIRKDAEHHFIFTNEVQHLLDSGYKINGVIAAWGSFTQDEGVARYATFAEGQLDKHENAPWLKPLLLAAYGTLATKAGYGETIFRLASKGEPVEISTGHHTLDGLLIKRARKLEPGIANVIHRGMIEAATRSESVGLAQWLRDTHGYKLLSIYADAVIIEHDDDRPDLPDLPEPWRVKRVLTHLQFINQQAFMSGEMTKLPGVGRDVLRYRQKSPGSAPSKPLYEAISGRPVKSDRRI